RARRRDGAVESDGGARGAVHARRAGARHHRSAWTGLARERHTRPAGPEAGRSDHSGADRQADDQPGADGPSDTGASDTGTRDTGAKIELVTWRVGELAKRIHQVANPPSHHILDSPL